MSNQASLGDISQETETDKSGGSEEKWSSVKIGNEDYFERYSGDTPTKSNEDYWDGDIKWLSNSEVSDEQVDLISETELRITEEGLDNCTAKIVPENSVILSCTASIGKVAINTDEMATNQQFNSFNIKKGFNPYFLANQLLYRGGELEAMGGSTTHNHLAVYVLEKFDLDKPPLGEQRRIASVLYNVDQAIQKTEEIIEQTQRVKEGLMQDLFTEGYLEHDEYEEAMIGPNSFNMPKSWDLEPLGDFIEEFNGGANLSPSDFTDEGVKVFPKGGVNARGIAELDEDEKQFVSEEYAQENEKYLVGNGYLMTALRDLVSSGPNIGRIVEIPEGDEYLMAQGVYGLSIDEEKLDRHYLVHLSNSKFYRKRMKQIKVGSTQVHIRKPVFSSVKIPVPPKDEQEKIAEVFNNINDKIRSERNQKEQLQRLKKGLMQDLLTGSVRTGEDVRVLDEVVEVEC